MKMVVEQGVIGNCRMLATIGKNGEVRYLFWPTIDYPQHIHASLPGVWLDNIFSWLTDTTWNREQRYLESTNVLETKFRKGDIEIKATDFVFMSKDILVRSFSFLSKRKIFLRFFYYKDTHLIETPVGDATYFEKEINGVIAYKRDYYLAYGSNEKSSGYQCGVHGDDSDAFKNVYDGKLNNNALALYLGNNGVNSALSWDINLESNEEKTINIFFCLGVNKQEVSELLNFARKNVLIEKTFETHKKWVAKAKLKSFNESRLSSLVKRSLLLIKSLHCSLDGGFIAAPCLEPDYRYCWPRDATYMAYALDAYGFHKESESFYFWCKKAQEKDGSWYQRYYIEACCPGPTWGMQCDQAGIILWGIGKHFEVVHNKNFLVEIRTTIEKAAKHLIKVLDKDNLISSIDLWEERKGKHIYTNAAVCAGFREVAKIEKILGNRKLSEKFKKVSNDMKKAIIRKFWSEEEKRFMRSIEPLDKTIDISILGMVFPFEIINLNDEKIKNTAKQIEKAFNYKIGGLGRYPSDAYYNGNPWIISTLWLSLYYSKIGEKEKAKNLFEWALAHISELGLMPEQVDKETGNIVSAFPLGWSHAMFLLAALELYAKK